MVRALSLVGALGALGGCSQILGLEDLHRGDAAIADVASDGPTATLSGRVRENNATFVGDAKVAFIRNSDQMALATTTSSSIGQYALTVPIGVDGYVLVRRAGDEDTYQYLAQPVTGDRALTAVVFTPSYIDSLAQPVGVMQSASGGFVLVRVEDAGANTVAGATATLDPPGKLFYVGPSGAPDPMQMVTDTAGLVTIFDAPPGTAMVSAQLGTSTAGARAIKVVGASLTAISITVM